MMVGLPLTWMLIALCAAELLTARYAPGRKLRTLLLWLPALHTVGGIGVIFLASRLAPDSPYADPHLAPIFWFVVAFAYEIVLTMVALVGIGTVLVLNVQGQRPA